MLPELTFRKVKHEQDDAAVNEPDDRTRIAAFAE